LTQNRSLHFTAAQGDCGKRGEIKKGPKGATMGILRKAIVAGGIFAALPTPPPGAQTQPVEQQAGPGTFAYVAAASDTYADLSSFCKRRPMACDVAHYLAITAQAKAKYSARIIYEWANEPEASPAAVRVLDTQTAEATGIPLPMEKPVNLIQRKVPHKKS
jgi:Family of unknown function (DUF5330)